MKISNARKSKEKLTVVASISIAAGEHWLAHFQHIDLVFHVLDSGLINKTNKKERFRIDYIRK